MLEDVITSDEIEQASLNKMSSYCSDGVSILWMVKFRKSTYVYYSYFCSIVQWNMGHQTRIFYIAESLSKPKQTTDNVSKYRLISLYNSDFKILMKIIALRLSKITNVVLNPLQGGIPTTKTMQYYHANKRNNLSCTLW